MYHLLLGFSVMNKTSVHQNWSSKDNIIIRYIVFCLKVEPTDERIDLEKLKVREKIHFYEDILLFDDELSDNGSSIMNVKIVSVKLF